MVAQNNQKYNWQSVSIGGGGFVDGIVCHPAEKGLRYARTDMGGAYRWDDASKRWIPLLDWVSYADYNLMGVESIALDPTNPQKLYLSCGTYTNKKTPTGAILYSNDKGQTFKRVDVPFKMGGNENGRGNGERMAVDPINSKTIYLGTRKDGLWRSLNGGKSWARVESFPNVVDSADLRNPHHYWQGGAGIVCVGFDGNAAAEGGYSSSYVYVAVSLMGRDNFFVSYDGGDTWQPVKGHPQKYRPTHMAMSSDGTIYLSYGDNPGPMPMTNGAVWKYTPHTGEWLDITPDKPGTRAKQGFGYAAVTVDVRNPQLVLASTFYRPEELGGEEIFRSLDGGKTWQDAMASGVTYNYDLAPYVKHTPIHWLFDVEMDPFDSNHVMFTTGYGGHETFNFSSIDDTTKAIEWHILAKGIEETVALELVSSPYKKGPQLYSAIGDYCGFAHYKFNESPEKGCFENPHFSNTNGIAYAGVNNWVMARVGKASHHTGGANIGFSINGGKTWMPGKSSPSTESRYGHIALSALGTYCVWTPEGEKPHLSTDMGASWKVIDELPVNARVVADKSDDLLFYAMSLFDGQLFVSRDGGKSFETKKLNLPNGIPQIGFRGDERGGQDRLYTVHGHNNHLWLAAYDGLYLSTNGGDTFERKPSVAQIHAFGTGKPAPKSKYPSLYMVGMVDGLFGIFRSDNMAQSWVRINDDNHQWGLILHISGDPKKYGRVYVGTHGRGIVYGDIAK